MQGGGLIGIGFEFLGIAGLFTAAGVYLDGRFSGHGLIMIAMVTIGMIAGIWHLVSRMKSAQPSAKIKPRDTPEIELKKMDSLIKKIDEMKK